MQFLVSIHKHIDVSHLCESPSFDILSCQPITFLHHAIDFAREKQFVRITLLMAPDREGKLLNFYRKSGFRQSEMVTMRLLIGGEEQAAL